MRALHVRLLGGFSIEAGTRALTGFGRVRGQALLARLILAEGAALPRALLAGTFWPDSTGAQARTNLRQEIHHLRRVAPEVARALVLEAQSVAWRPERWSFDVHGFETRLAEAGRVDDATNRDRLLAEAVDTYAGELLPGFDDDWLVVPRRRLHERFLEALGRLARDRYDAGHFDDAVGRSRQLLHHLPLEESVHALLIRSHLGRGDRTAAQAAWDRCRKVLQTELGVEPGSVIQALGRSLESNPSRAAPDAASMTPAELADSLIGREHERARIDAVRCRLRPGEISLSVIAASAGAGKTHLAEACIEAWQGLGLAVARARCPPAARTETFAAVRRWLQSPALQAALTSLASQDRRLLDALVDQPKDAGANPVDAAAARQRRNDLFSALLRLIQRFAEPVVLLLDDLQWCDDSSIDWLRTLGEQSSAPPILVLATARDDEIEGMHAQAWFGEMRALGRLQWLALPELDREQCRRLALRELARPGTHPDRAASLALNLDAVLERAGGNPLFVLEFVRARMQAHVGSVCPELPIPDRVQSLIEHRLSRLGSGDAAVLNLAAVIDTPFTLALLARASGRDQADAGAAVDRLCQRRLLRARSGGHFDFEHDCIREVVYARLSPSTRIDLHGKLAAAIEETTRLGGNPPATRLAAHHARAGNPYRAIHWYRQVAQAAWNVHSVDEAIANLHRALEQVPQADADEQIQILRELWTFHSALEGQAGPSVASVVKAMAARLPLVREPLVHYRALHSMQVHYGVSGQSDQALVCARELVAVGARVSNPWSILEARSLLAGAHLHMAQWQDCARQCDAAIEGVRGFGPARAAEASLGSLTVFATRAIVAVVLGDRPLAVALATEVEKMPRDQLIDWHQTVLDFWLCHMYRLLDDVDLAHHHARKLLAVAERRGYAGSVAYGLWACGWARARRGCVEDGIAQMREGLRQAKLANVVMWRSMQLTELAGVLLAQGRPLEAVEILDQAASATQRGGGRGWLPEACGCAARPTRPWGSTPPRPKPA
ncbi:MAG: BTAD domain-containing putative transcriptional regulator [Burkholderiaceae bacterium]